MALDAAPISNEAFYSRCGGDGTREEENGADDGSEECGDCGNDNNDGVTDNTEIASNSPEQD